MPRLDKRISDRWGKPSTTWRQKQRRERWQVDCDKEININTCITCIYFVSVHVCYKVLLYLLLNCLMCMYCAVLITEIIKRNWEQVELVWCLTLIIVISLQPKEKTGKCPGDCVIVSVCDIVIITKYKHFYGSFPCRQQALYTLMWTIYIYLTNMQSTQKDTCKNTLMYTRYDREETEPTVPLTISVEG